MTAAIFPGTFDPVTYGHIDVIRRASGIFDKIIVAVATNPNKIPLFTKHERVQFIKELTSDIPNVEVLSFSGITVNFVKSLDVSVIVRGIRTFSDFEFEAALANANRRLDPDIETVFIMSGTEYSYISSTMIRELASFGGNIEAFVPKLIAQKLIDRMKQNGTT